MRTQGLTSAELEQRLKQVLAENERLRKRVLELTAELKAREGHSAQEVQAELDRVLQQLEAQNRKLFGASSEVRKEKPSTPKERKPRERHGPTKQPKLLEVTRRIELPPESPLRVCPDCKSALSESGMSEKSELIDVEPQRYVVVVQERAKYRCAKPDCQSAIVTAPVPKRLIPGGRYSDDVAIEVAVSLHADHMPIERQVKSMARSGLKVTSQTLWDQKVALADALESVWLALKSRILESPRIGVDETRWKLMGKEGAAPWVIWALSTERIAYYEFEAGNRTNAGVERLLGDYSGTVMSDGFAGYTPNANRRWRQQQCWAHARRGFVESEPHQPEARALIEAIGKLYHLEPEKTASREERARVHDGEMRNQVAHIFELANRLKGGVLPGSALGKAIAYLLARQQALTLFCDDPDLPLDNNQTERIQRGIVVGRKNYYGSRSERGTKAAAILYSLIETAKLNNIDVRAYLKRAVEAVHEGRPIPLPLAD